MRLLSSRIQRENTLFFFFLLFLLTYHHNVIIFIYEDMFICGGEAMEDMKKGKSGPIVEEANDFLAVHKDVVVRVLETQPEDEYLYDLAELFKVFGDTTRIRILYALFESELCVNDIAQVLGLSQSAVSHQLRILKDAKLVKFRRNGKIIFYSLDDDHVRNIIAMGMEHVEE